MTRTPRPLLCAVSFAAAMLSAGSALAQSKPATPAAPAAKPATGPLAAGSIGQLKDVMGLIATAEAPDYAPQTLNPVGGSLPMPKGWKLREVHTDVSYQWLASSPTETAPGRADARLRVVLEPNVLKAEKQKPSVWVASQVAEIVKAHPDVKACQPSRAGLFIKVCYDFEQDLLPAPAPLFHIHATYYYADELNVAGATLFSARKDQWENWASVQAKMDAVELFDTKKFGAQAATPPKPTAAAPSKDKAASKK